MLRNTYRVQMETPLGEKTGTLFAEKNGNTLNGWLDILRHRESFEGTIDEAGNCRISGVFITLIRRVPYVAAGQISAASISLKVKDGRNIFDLTGVACAENEE